MACAAVSCGSRIGIENRRGPKFVLNIGLDFFVTLKRRARKWSPDVGSTIRKDKTSTWVSVEPKKTSCRKHALK